MLCLILRALAEPDTTRENIKIHRTVERYTANELYFNDSLGKTVAEFNENVVVEMFAKQNYVHLTVSGGSNPIQGVYLIVSYQTTIFNKTIIREWFVVDENVELIILDENSTMYFIRHDGQMMIIPDCIRH